MESLHVSDTVADVPIKWARTSPYYTGKTIGCRARDPCTAYQSAVMEMQSKAYPQPFFPPPCPPVPCCGPCMGPGTSPCAPCGCCQPTCQQPTIGKPDCCAVCTPCTKPCCPCDNIYCRQCCNAPDLCQMECGGGAVPSWKPVTSPPNPETECPEPPRSCCKAAKGKMNISSKDGEEYNAGVCCPQCTDVPDRKMCMCPTCCPPCKTCCKYPCCCIQCYTCVSCNNNNHNSTVLFKSNNKEKKLCNENNNDDDNDDDDTINTNQSNLNIRLRPASPGHSTPLTGMIPNQNRRFETKTPFSPVPLISMAVPSYDCSTNNASNYEEILPPKPPTSYDDDGSGFYSPVPVYLASSSAGGGNNRLKMEEKNNNFEYDDKSKSNNHGNVSYNNQFPVEVTDRQKIVLSTTPCPCQSKQVDAQKQSYQQQQQKLPQLQQEEQYQRHEQQYQQYQQQEQQQQHHPNQNQEQFKQKKPPCTVMTNDHYMPDFRTQYATNNNRIGQCSQSKTNEMYNRRQTTNSKNNCPCTCLNRNRLLHHNQQY